MLLSDQMIVKLEWKTEKIDRKCKNECKICLNSFRLETKNHLHQIFESYNTTDLVLYEYKIYVTYIV